MRVMTSSCPNSARGAIAHVARAAQHVYTYIRIYVLLAAAGTTSVRDMAEASVDQATAGETSCASSCEESTVSAMSKCVF